MEKCRNVFVIALILQFKFSELQYSAPEADLENEYGKLVLVASLFRHGERSPYSSYPKDPYQTYPWPDGLGQLTKAGERRMYNIGKWYKQRYSNLVKQIRSHTNITARSSDKDRTIMSAQCLLAGFYPVQDENSKSLPWQPIPIHTIPVKYDNILVIKWDNTCPMKQYYEKKFFDLETTKKLYDDHENTFHFLRNHTGYSFLKNNIFQSVKEVDKVYDTLLVQSENNLTLPPWSQKVFPRPLLTIKESLKYKTAELYPEVKRLMAGPFLASVISDMVEKSKNYSTKIFHFYSSHDDVITYVSMALGFNDNINPSYGSGLVFELRRKGNQHTVSVFWTNSTTTTPQELMISECGTPCTLEKFVNFTSKLIPDNWYSECQLKEKNNPQA